MSVQKNKNNFKKGFTLLEILLVVAIIAILAGIVIIALNPGKQLADGRNSQRKADVNTIVSAAYQYMIDNNGTIPAAIPTNATPETTCTVATSEICKTGAASCTGLVDLSSTLTNNQKYTVAMPVDPACPSTNVNGTCYFISKGTYGRLTACSSNTSDGPTVSVTK